MPQYKLADQAKADALDREAVAASDAGNHAGEVGDDYIRITVFLPAVLFLVGIGSTVQAAHHPLRADQRRLAAAHPGYRPDPAAARASRLIAVRTDLRAGCAILPQVRMRVGMATTLS